MTAYARKRGKYSFAYDKLYNNHVTDGQKSFSVIGEFLRIITNVYNDTMKQPTNVFLSKDEFFFLSNMVVWFSLRNKEELYYYFMMQMMEVWWANEMSMPTNVPDNFTYTLDDILDEILAIYGNEE